MVRSIFKKASFIGFFVLALFAIFSGCFTYVLIAIHFFKSALLRSSLTKGESIVFICVFAFFTFSIIRLLLLHPVNITIETTNQKIVFKHVFLAIRTSYSFSDFDYYFETIEHSIGDTSKAIYLIKNGKRERVIRRYYYSNVDEMKDALKGISDHGFKELSRLKVLLLYFSRKL